MTFTGTQAAIVETDIGLTTPGRSAADSLLSHQQHKAELCSLKVELGREAQ